MKKIAKILMLGLALVSCVRRYPDPNGWDVRDMMASTVKIEVNVVGTMIKKVGTNPDGSAVTSSESGVTVSWSGSGVVVAVDPDLGNGESLVMSAAHVTNVPPMAVMLDEATGAPALFVVDAVIQVVQTLDGRTCEAEEIWVDVPRDIGMVRADCVAGIPAALADDLPPVGAIVSTTGAALGYHPNGVFIATDGRYVGMEDGKDPQVIVTLPAAPGHSGSGIFYNGKIFGIISRHVIGYGNITFGVSLQHMKEAMAKGMAQWKGD